MPNLSPLGPRFGAALAAAVVLAFAVPACGGSAGADAEADDESGSYFDGEEARVEVDPCALLTKEELSEQLYLSLSPRERDNYANPDFDITATEPQLGTSRVCEYQFASRDSVGGGATWHSDFTLTVFPLNALALQDERREPIEGGTSEMFKERGTSVVYVVKGPLAVSIHHFPPRDEDEPGGVDGGRLVLLRHIAERLP